MPQSALWSFTLLEQSSSYCLGDLPPSSCLGAREKDVFHPDLEFCLWFLPGSSFVILPWRFIPTSCLGRSSLTSCQGASSPASCLGAHLSHSALVEFRIISFFLPWDIFLQPSLEHVSLTLPGSVISIILPQNANSVILPANISANIFPGSLSPSSCLEEESPPSFLGPPTLSSCPGAPNMSCWQEAESHLEHRFFHLAL